MSERSGGFSLSSGLSAASCGFLLAVSGIFLHISIWVVFYGSGVIGTLIMYGLLQERIMTVPYGSPGVHFTDSMALVFCNRLLAFLFALVMAVLKGESLSNKAPGWKYIAISFSHVYAYYCIFEALKYVSFTVQMLGQSFKMMPVMLWGMIVSDKRYSLMDWLTALVVTGSVTQFLLGGPIAADLGGVTVRPYGSYYGLLLLLAFLVLEGFTSTFQEKLFKQHTTTKYNQMIYINFSSCVIAFVTLVVSGRLYPAMAFAAAQPLLVRDAVMLSIASVCSQWFNYSMVKEFGALALAGTLNIRQVVSILLSNYTYGHSITGIQIFSIVVVFSALFYKSFMAIMYPWPEKEPLASKGSAAVEWVTNGKAKDPV